MTDSARFMAVITAAEAHATIAVMDAKYKYAFWRPITAIRNGDIDGNDATEREATWQPIDNTPMHPEYPCAHCIVASALEGVLESSIEPGSSARLESTSPTAGGVTRSWAKPEEFVKEVAEAGADLILFTPFFDEREQMERLAAEVVPELS